MNFRESRRLVLAPWLFPAFFFVLPAFFTWAQTATPAPDPHAVPSIDGGIGSCSADLTITDDSGAPVYLAKVTVHVAYGFMNKHKLELELSTNVDGRARITGLPDRIKHGFYFRASQGDQTGEAFDDPANTCKAQFTIPLQKKNP